MSFARGERVYFDFDSGAVQPADPCDQTPEQHQQEPLPAVSAAFVGDILERETSAPVPPSAPTFKKNTTGFPAHRKRDKKISAFKQQRTGKNDVSFTSSAQTPDVAQAHDIKSGVVGYGNASGKEKEKEKTEQQRIDEENRQRLAEMSPEEIEQERRELLSALSPSLIEKLLRRSNIDEGRNEQDWDKEPKREPAQTSETAPAIPEKKSTSTKKVTFEEPPEPESIEQEEHRPSSPPQHQDSHTSPSEPAQPVPTASPPQDQQDLSLYSSIHFPVPAQPPDLDPSSPTFLQDLHQKYFPNLPYSPSSLSWMTPISPTDTTSPYHPSHRALSPADLRFDFKGRLLPPSVARELPTTLGLHHHADAPEAAGYTIPELARLARSKVASQRCVAYQTLGRVLYRLGIGEYGQEKGDIKTDGPVQVAKDEAQEDDGEDEDERVADDPEEAASVMATGLWNLVEECKVIESLTEEAGKERGHLTARTYAQEALWNWRRGGGRKRRAV